MIFKKNFRSPLSLLETYSWSLVIAWTIIIGGLLLFGISQIRHVQREMVKKEANVKLTIFRTDRYLSNEEDFTHNIEPSYIGGEKLVSRLVV